MNEIKPVLYADDDENDVFLMERAFEMSHIPNPLRHVADGEDAVAYLEGKTPFADRDANPVPALVLLDLSMPGRHGLDVSTWIKNEPKLADVPVVVFSSSKQDSDVRRAYSLGANGFLVKPGDPDDLTAMVKALYQYWLAGERPGGSFLDFAATWIMPPPPPNGRKKEYQLNLPFGMEQKNGASP